MVGPGLCQVFYKCLVLARFCHRHGKFLNFGRRGIETNTGLNPFLKIVLNVFCMHKTDIFSYIIYLIQYIVGYNMNKYHPWRPWIPILREWVQSRLGSYHGLDFYDSIKNIIKLIFMSFAWHYLFSWFKKCMQRILYVNTVPYKSAYICGKYSI